MTSSGEQMQEGAAMKKRRQHCRFCLAWPLKMTDLSSEVDRLIAEPQLQSDDNALQCWTEMNIIFYIMVAKCARRLLYVPATSVPSERIFSTVGQPEE